MRTSFAPAISRWPTTSRATTCRWPTSPSKVARPCESSCTAVEPRPASIVRPDGRASRKRANDNATYDLETGSGVGRRTGGSGDSRRRIRAARLRCPAAAGAHSLARDQRGSTCRPRAAVWSYRSHSTERRRVELCADRHVTGTFCGHRDRARGGRHGRHQSPNLCHLRCAASHAAARWTTRRAAVDAQSDHAPQLHARVAVRAAVRTRNCDVPGPARGVTHPPSN